jgi:hypothetical protein
MNPIVEALEYGKRRLLEKGWTRGAFARNSYNHPVDHDDASAVAFCMRGALPNTTDARVIVVLNAAVRRRLGRWESTAFYNDVIAKDRSDAIAVYDEAIAIAKDETQLRNVLARAELSL